MFFDKESESKIPEGKYKAVEMMIGIPHEDDDPKQTAYLLKQIALIDKHNYVGAYTIGLGDCVAVALIAKDKDGNGNKMLMAHFQGGINDECARLLIKKLKEIKFLKKTNMELIIAPGSIVSSFLLESGIDEMKQVLKNEGSCNIKNTVITAGSPNRFVTLDGQTGGVSPSTQVKEDVEVSPKNGTSPTKTL